jgi:hypothetical protein
MSTGETKGKGRIQGLQAVAARPHSKKQEKQIKVKKRKKQT